VVQEDRELLVGRAVGPGHGDRAGAAGELEARDVLAGGGPPLGDVRRAGVAGAGAECVRGRGAWHQLGHVDALLVQVFLVEDRDGDVVLDFFERRAVVEFK